jgi:hypothetical protein
LCVRPTVPARGVTRRRIATSSAAAGLIRKRGW